MLWNYTLHCSVYQLNLTFSSRFYFGDRHLHVFDVCHNALCHHHDTLTVSGHSAQVVTSSEIWQRSCDLHQEQCRWCRNSKQHEGLLHSTAVLLSSSTEVYTKYRRIHLLCLLTILCYTHHQIFISKYRRIRKHGHSMPIILL